MSPRALVNTAAFGVPLIAPGQLGVPAGDPYETSYGTTGRNIFRASFQSRFDFSAFKETQLTERFALRFDAQLFNIFNHPVFDAPNNNVAFHPSFCRPPDMTTSFNCGAPPGYLIPPSGNGAAPALSNWPYTCAFNLNRAIRHHQTGLPPQSRFHFRG